MEWIISIGYLAAFVAALLGIALALIFLHELGHLSAAWLVGWTPFVFRVGGGRLLLGWRCGELSLQVGRNVFFGYVRAAANSPQLFRTKQIVFATGGVIATSLVLLLLAWVALRLDTPYPAILQPLLPLALYFNLVLLIGVLWPHTTRIGGRDVPSDGRVIWNTLWLKRSQLQEHFAAHRAGFAEVLLTRGEVVRAYAVVRDAAALTANPLSLNLAWIHSLLAFGKLEEARQASAQLLAVAPTPAARVEILDGLACIPVYYGDRSGLPDAVAHIEAALRLAPDKITLSGTKASLLIEEGKLEEGIALLERVVASSESAHDQAISTFYLALAHFRRGDVQRAEKHLRRACALEPVCLVRPRVESEIRGTPLPQPDDTWIS